jgi:hypothetical protein
VRRFSWTRQHLPRLHHSDHHGVPELHQPLIAQSPLHGLLDDAVLDAQRIIEMISNHSKNAISQDK